MELTKEIELSDSNQDADAKQVEYFRMWVGCPEDFANTPDGVATQAYIKLSRHSVSIEAHKLLSYMRGRLAMPLKDFEAVQDVYMCDSSADREAVRNKYK